VANNPCDVSITLLDMAIDLYRSSIQNSNSESFYVTSRSAPKRTTQGEKEAFLNFEIATGELQKVGCIQFFFYFENLKLFVFFFEEKHR
jgi:hypothetical protein